MRFKCGDTILVRDKRYSPQQFIVHIINCTGVVYHHKILYPQIYEGNCPLPCNATGCEYVDRYGTLLGELAEVLYG